MTARDDYPDLAGCSEQADAALDEIDRLRAWAEEYVGTLPPDGWTWEP